ncbi:hypothetical protein DTQ70_30450 (plasmid) [Runella sp. SP2]|nr:hypothetical protein DTQ70_30450 [Runella sp. SP2]
MIKGDTLLQKDTERLRKLSLLDKAAYRTAKTRLPYVVGSIFRDGVRRIDNFVQAHCLIVDVDHLPNFDGVVPASITADRAVALAFVSPSGQGFKVVFTLEQPCNDAKLFQAFYKSFVSQFAERTGLVSSVDLRTSDASRACFLAHDANAYFNPNAEPLVVEIMTLEEDLFSKQTLIEKKEATKTETKPIFNETAYREVLREVSPTAPTRTVKQAFVPQELLDFMPEIDVLCQKAGLEVFEKMPIQYGIKVLVKQGYRKAEVNVFFGKRGFSVVKSPKTGTDAALMDLLYGILYAHLFPAPISENVPLVSYLSAN